MASVNQIVAGLEILAKTAEVPKGLAERGVTDTRHAELSGADHDIIWGPAADPSDEDIKRLEVLGWHLCSETGYWAHFV